MANNYTEILALANKNNMGLSNTIKRDYGIPLDYSSVQETYDAALNYAKTSTLAYIGQPISVGDTLYIVTDEAGGYLKAVGTKPTGDNKSITVGDDGKVAMFGFEAAADQTLPQKKPNGSIEWVPIDSIVSGDGNTKTIVTAADGSEITVTPTYNSENDTYTYTLDVTFPAIPEYSLTKETSTDKVTYKLTKDGTQVGETIEVPNAYDDTAITEDIESIDGRVTAVEGTVEDHGTRLEGIEAFFKDAAKDSGSGDSLQNALDTLVEIQEYITNDGQAADQMLESISANADAIEVLNGTGDNSVSGQIASAISAKDTEYNGKFATQDEVSAVRDTANAAAVKTEVEAALAGKVDNSVLDNYYVKTDTYSQDEVDNLLAGITGTDGSIADLQQQLTDHEAANTASFDSLAEKDTALEEAIEQNTSDIAAINNETTGIYQRAIKTAAEDAQSKVNALATGKVALNESAIDALEGQVENINTNINTINGQIGNLQQTDTNLSNDLSTLQGQHNTLSSKVGEHTTAISDLTTRLNTAEGNITANTAKFDEYSTTTQVEEKISKAISDKATEDVGKYADKALFEAEVSRSTEKDTELTGLVEAAQEKANANEEEISKINATLTSIIDGPGKDGESNTLDSIKELAQWIQEHDGANGVLDQVNKNKAAIELLNEDENTEGSVKKTVKDAIAAIPTATTSTLGLVKASTEIEVDGDGIMSIGVVSTDKLTQGLNTLVLNGGSASVTA